MLKLTEHDGITISLLYKQKTRWNSDIQIFYNEIVNFRLFYAKNHNLAQFSGPACLYDYVTPWPIVLILVCVDREGPYLPIDTKINYIEGSVWKI